jgi:cyclic pyranopterin phosphate synthase
MAAEGKLTHFNEQGRAKMVDVTDKQETSRTAVAETSVTMNRETLELIKQGRIGKGDVLSVAQIAGIMAAKNTSNWIPMCHPLPITGVDIRFADDQDSRLTEDCKLTIEATVKTKGQTGVEMEALTAVSAAALTVYDMCKAVQKDMVIGPTRLLSKTGGKSGDYRVDI